MNKHTLVTVALVVTLFVSLAFINSTKYADLTRLALEGFRLKPTAITIANNTGLCALCADGISQYTVSSPSKADYHFTCSDTDGCRVYLLETGDLHEGQVTGLTNIGTNTITVTEVTNVRNLSAASVALGAKDVLQLKRAGGEWVQNYLGNN